jgi:segregation and condensation protein A
MTSATTIDDVEGQAPASGFSVTLDEFSGPFDLLLALIAKQQLDVTAMALHAVTDEFLAYIRGRGSDWTLDEATYFVLVAATLLDLKAARLLPGGKVDDEEDLALLEARDLLFARLLQYRAFKQVSGVFAEMMAATGVMRPRAVGLDAAFQSVLPDVVLGVGAEQFAVLAAHAMRPKLVPQVGLSHLHVPRVSVREQAAILVQRLRQHRQASFRMLVSDCDSQLMVVARFLALLELFRDAVVAFEQLTPLGDLQVRWTGSDDAQVHISDEFDAEPTDAVEGGEAPSPSRADTVGDKAEPQAPQATTESTEHGDAT